eukprot:TRINITY_DN10750_c0_g1_i1.p1 TRINITY_DN10750_c0_g1~~TRINITY_DN10750_c0_g1_i1.p1  ORF type:complete len:121 (+),score=42.77 TRINITY_DN10750_c0_g1_i1:100-462(+)
MLRSLVGSEMCIRDRLIIVAFASVTTLSALLFATSTKASVDTNIQLALRSAMDHVMQPLQESDRYIDGLRDKIEKHPTLYGVDDEQPNSLALTPSVHQFFFDVLTTAMKRQELTLSLIHI